MSMYAKVRRLRLREGLSISEIARRTSLSRNTIKTWLREPAPRTEMAYKRPPGPKVLAGFTAWLDQAIKTDEHRPRKERRTGRRLFEQLQEQGFKGHYCRVTEYLRAKRAAVGAVTARSAYVPLQFGWGEAFQFDWSEEGLVIGGIWRKVQLAHMKLCASRAFWMVAYPSQGHEMLFDAHLRCLTGLGGVPRRGIYDNMKTAVDKTPRPERLRKVNTRFAAMATHYLFEPDFCNVASGWEKGRVEKAVLDGRRRIWQRAQEKRWVSFAELNVWLATQCTQGWSAPHPDCRSMTIAEALALEHPELMPVPSAFDGYVEADARVSSTCLVTVARNRYSVPCALAGHRVVVHLYPERVAVVANRTVVAEHARIIDRDRVVYDWRHYVPLIERKPGALRNGAPFADLPAPLGQLSRHLLRRAGGDRVMAQVLAAVPRFGLEAVLVAVELALESGRPSAEHVLNLLARLHEGPPPDRVETALTVATAPLADTARYDHLRPEVAHD
ncbi:MAG: IS21 family transposase [Arenimonas sp.]|nr:IS21 family transposase [Arenimonas sp.]